MNELLTALLNFSLIAGLWWLFFFEFPAYRLNLVRHKIFVERDHLFQSALRGDLPFSSRAYGITRNIINGMIRHTHSLSMSGAIGALVAERCAAEPDGADRFERNYERAIAMLPSAGCRAVLHARHMVHRHWIDYVLNKNFVVSLATLPFRVIRYSRNLKRWARSKSRRWSVLDAQYEGIGDKGEVLAH
ncbi:MAG: hypothetical protein HY273_10025 [Gammaproteobacteria bacterium]|nr:hypothetical protein [Gammaproteobacteria bacterium]